MQKESLEALLAVTDLKVALICVKDEGLLLVKLPHHLHGEAVDGHLEVRLLSVHHDSHVFVTAVLQNQVHQLIS